MKAGTEEEFERLLEFLQQNRGFDFTGYKRPSLMRRVSHRMQLVNVGAFTDYVDYLQVHPEEFGQLFNAILINVTAFFRDPDAWDYVRAEVVPAILEGKRGGEPVRVWSAGCASGEEAYTLAMMFAEAMGRDEFLQRTKIYATDVDEEALAQARMASYTEKDLEGLDPALLERYFERAPNRFVFRGDLRRAVIFGRNDLVQDAPISRLDLLVCRNTLMYFNAETQAKALSRFHFALNGEGTGTGYLFLGRAEMMLAHSQLFSPLDLKSRVFQKVPQPGARQRITGSVQSQAQPHVNGNGEALMTNRMDRLREQAIEETPVPRIMVDGNGALAIANQRARLLFSLSPKDIGRPLQDLELSYRPIELRSLIEQAYSERRSVTQTSVERKFPDGETQYFDVIVSPVFDGLTPLGVGITFMDVTRAVKLQEEVRKSRELIQTTNEQLQSSNEELETTNEELQSSNEELETTNEELQSTNEELETMNEELQSTNEELQAVNEELRQRTDEANRANSFLESVLSSLHSGAVVLDQNFNVSVWNERAEDLWGLRAEEVRGKSLFRLDIGLPLIDLRDPIRACLTGDSDHEQRVVEAVNRRGKKIKCRISCSPLVSSGKRRDGVILLMEEA